MLFDEGVGCLLVYRTDLELEADLTRHANQKGKSPSRSYHQLILLKKLFYLEPVRLAESTSLGHEVTIRRRRRLQRPPS